jgi:hypothetical protein
MFWKKSFRIGLLSLSILIFSATLSRAENSYTLSQIDSIMQYGPQYKKASVINNLMSIPGLDSSKAVDLLLNAIKRELEHPDNNKLLYLNYIPNSEHYIQEYSKALAKFGFRTRDAIYEIKRINSISPEFELRLNLILGFLKDPEVHATIREMYYNSQNYCIRQFAIESLVAYSDSVDIPVFKAALQDSFYFFPSGAKESPNPKKNFPIKRAAIPGLANWGYRITIDGDNFTASRGEAPEYKSKDTPELKQYPSMLDKSFPKFEMDFTATWNNSMELLFLSPYDAIVLHVLIDATPKDVFIVSDPGLNTLMFIQCALENNFRKLEKISIFAGDENTRFKGPSGLATTAVGRLFDPESDEILVAERWGNRIIAISYFPDKDGGTINIERTFGEQYLHTPLEIALTDYGTGSAKLADLFVIESGAGEDDGGLVRFGFDGNYLGRWNEIRLPGVNKASWRLNQPSGLTCYFNANLSKPVLCITEKTSNSVFFMSITQTGEPVWEWSYFLQVAGPYWDPRGVAVDDLGRIYVANAPMNQIEMFSPSFVAYFPPYGKMPSGLQRFSYPINILIDTYHGNREALVIENSATKTGFQSFIIDGANPPPDRNMDSGGMILPKKFVSHKAEIPSDYSLSDPYPNPFNDKCIIEFAIPEAAQVDLELYDILGRKVTTIFNEFCNPGKRRIIFQARGLASGVYYYRMKSGKYSSEKSMLLLK